jgi:hypothetical protein
MKIAKTGTVFMMTLLKGRVSESIIAEKMSGV